jgi:6-phosphogluconolactonase
MATRRKVLAWLATTVAGAWVDMKGQSGLFSRRPKAVPPAPPAMVYFGTDTLKNGAKGIYAARFDLATGHFGALSLAAACLRPTYLAEGRVRDLRLLYAANEGGADHSNVSTLSMNAGTGALRAIGEVVSGGSGPCYIAVHQTGESAYVANYNGGTVSSFRVQGDGTLSPPVQIVEFKQGTQFGHHGPNAERQESSHPHCATISPDGRFLLVCDLGNDSIAVFPIDGATGKMGAVQLMANRTPGAGPRHVAFHPNGRWVYGVDELTSTVEHYLWNEVHGSPTMPPAGRLTDAGPALSTLDPGYKGTNTAAEIVVSPGGRFVYVSNRGEDSLAVFAVDEGTGALRGVQRIGCGGKSPRHFMLDAEGHWLICGNTESDSVAVFARDQATGRLSGPVFTLAVPAPMFSLFA